MTGWRKAWTLSEAEELQREYLSEERPSIRKLAERHNRSYGVTQAMLRAANTPMRQRGGSYSPEKITWTIDQAHALRREYESDDEPSIQDIADRHLLPWQVVRTMLHAAGTKMRKRGGAYSPKLKRAGTIGEALELRREYESDDEPSIQEIADRHGLPYPVGRTMLHAAGTNMRKPHGYRPPRRRRPPTVPEAHVVPNATFEPARHCVLEVVQQAP